MKKRRQRLQQAANNQSSALEQTQIHEISMEKNHAQGSGKHYDAEKGYSTAKKGPIPSSDSKSCLQNAKQKMALYFFRFLNYLQFDQAFTKQQLEALKHQNYIFKNKFSDNYYLSYEERAKTFGMSVDEMIKKKEQDQQQREHQYGLWSQIKKFICCEGADQLEEADQMVTAASESQFYYLTKARHSIEKEKLELTQESIIQNPHQTNSKPQFHKEPQFKKESKKMIRQKSLSKDHQDEFFFGQKQTKKSALSNTNQQQTNEEVRYNPKNINIDAIRPIQKSQLKNVPNFENNDENIGQKKPSSSLKQTKNKKTTQKVYVQRKSDDQKQQSEHYEPKINRQNLTKNDQKLFKNQNKTLINYNQNNQNPVNDKNSDDNRFQERYVQETSQISSIENHTKMNRKQSQSTMSIANPITETRKNAFKFQKQAFENKSQNSEKNILSSDASNQQSIYKILPFNQGNFKFSEPKKIQEDSIGDFIPFEDSEIISVTQSQTLSLSVDQKTKKQNKRKQKRNDSIQKSDDNLQIIQQQNLYESGHQDNQNQMLEDSIIQDHRSLQMDREHNLSASSDHIGCQTKKNALKLDASHVLDFSIKQGKEEEDNNKQQSHQISFDDTKSGGNLSQRGEGQKVFKKKKARNKKLFNLKEQQESVNEVVFFAENQQDQFMDKLQSKTMSLADSYLSANDQSKMIKKRRKNKRIKQLDSEKNDDVIILEAGQMVEDRPIKDQLEDSKINQSSEFKMIKENSGVVNPMKVEKKKKRKAKLRQEMERQEQEMEIVDLGEMN